MGESTGSRWSSKVPRRPNKPYPEFPLTPHLLGYWSKKVGGKLLHFGRWGRVVKGVVTPVENQEAAWQEAIRLYKARIDDVKAGEIGPGPVVSEKAETAEGYRVKDLCNEFRAAKLQ
jgi:hypothetical protein